MKILEIISQSISENDYDYDEEGYNDVYAYDYDDFFSDEENEKWDRETKEKIKDAHDSIDLYTSSGMGSGSELDQAYAIITKYQPEYIYSGDMYRSIEVKSEEFVVPDLRIMTAKLQRWVMGNARHVASWSSDEQAAIDHAYSFEIGLVLHQQSQGLDVVKANPRTVSPGEREILSPYSNRVSIHGYVYKDDFFPATDFNGFLKHLKSVSN
jgi:hypothetical protein